MRNTGIPVLWAAGCASTVAVKSVVLGERKIASGEISRADLRAPYKNRRKDEGDGF